MALGILRWLRGSPIAPHLKIGTSGERMAVRHLQRKGMTVLGRNVRLGKDEIDVIAFDPVDRVLAFVEVKSRAKTGDYHPSLNMTPEKRRRMIRAARRWVNNHGYSGGYRLDAAYVYTDGTTEYVPDLSIEIIRKERFRRTR